MTSVKSPTEHDKNAVLVRQRVANSLAVQFAKELAAIGYLPESMWGELTLRFRDGRLVILELKQQHKIDSELSK